MNDKIIWTMRITWLLLSLGLLFHAVCSEDEITTTTTAGAAIDVIKDATGDGMTVRNISDGSLESQLTTAGTEKIAHNLPTTISPDVHENVEKSIAKDMGQTVVLPSPTTDNLAPTTTAPSTDKPTERLATTLRPPTTIKSITPVPRDSKTTTIPTVLVHETPRDAAATVSHHTTIKATQTTTPTPAHTTTHTDSIHSSAAPTQAVTTPKTRTSLPSVVFVTVPPDTAGTIKITTATAKPTRSGQDTTVHSSISSKDSKTVEVTEENIKTTMSAAAQSQATSRTTKPAEITTTSAVLTDTSKKEANSAQAITPFPPKTTITTTRGAQTSTFVFSLNERQERKDDKNLAEVCRRMMADMHDGNCTLTLLERNGKTLIDGVDISGKVKTSLANHYYEELNKKSGDNTTLIAILASCGALLAMIIGLAIYASHHRKPYNENQQHLTEELHTVENGYHDNPTLEVMEVQPEMQEKKVALNGEFNDSWIVPIDNLLKGEILDEEDTHL
ncbi:hypothetical protein LDENG_00199110 [Lucifuga dentata]|nr:hypothetical protein LDENG_00199110 [Lucifuga dentata]